MALTPHYWVPSIPRSPWRIRAARALQPRYFNLLALPCFFLPIYAYPSQWLWGIVDRRRSYSLFQQLSSPAEIEMHSDWDWNRLPYELQAPLLLGLLLLVVAIGGRSRWGRWLAGLAGLLSIVALLLPVIMGQTPGYECAAQPGAAGMVGHVPRCGLDILPGYLLVLVLLSLGLLSSLLPAAGQDGC